MKTGIETNLFLLKMDIASLVKDVERLRDYVDDYEENVDPGEIKSFRRHIEKRMLHVQTSVDLIDHELALK